MTYWGDDEPDDSGYDRDDPKHPDWADAAADRADMDRKREKEDRADAEERREARTEADRQDAIDRRRCTCFRKTNQPHQHAYDCPVYAAWVGRD